MAARPVTTLPTDRRFTRVRISARVGGGAAHFLSGSWYRHITLSVQWLRLKHGKTVPPGFDILRACGILLLKSSPVSFGKSAPFGLRPEGVFFGRLRVNKVVFIVDGFNLYHSLVDAEEQTGQGPVKWLDLRGLCSSYVSAVAGRLGGRAVLEHIYYFSAPPTHRSATKQLRHSLYMRCLRETGIDVQLGRFKNKDIHCPPCCHSPCPNPTRSFVGHEEKETDVALAAKLFEVCHTREADAVVLMTGDTDLAPAVRSGKRLFPTISILFAFPFKRANAELQSIAPGSFPIKPHSCYTHQFPNPLILSDGTPLAKPATW